MAETIERVMTRDPVCLDAGTPIVDAARSMEERNIGDVLVMTEGKLCGIVTDRDIAVRAVAHGMDPGTSRVGDICSRQLVTLRPEDSVDDAIAQMREHALRRMPVCDEGRPVGIVSLGDLAEERDRMSVLGQISTAPANH